MTKHFVEFIYPGLFFSEYSAREIADRNVVIHVPYDAFAYRFFDREEVELNGETLRGDNKNYSGIIYFGEIYDRARVGLDVPNNDILLSNMRGNGWDKVVKTIAGNFQPLEANDKVISVTAVAA